MKRKKDVTNNLPNRPTGQEKKTSQRRNVQDFKFLEEEEKNQRNKGTNKQTSWYLQVSLEQVMAYTTL